MTEAPASFDCVVDGSVGIKLFLVEPLSEEAHALLAHLSYDLPAHTGAPEDRHSSARTLREST